MTRQALEQKRNVAAGKCGTCGKSPLASKCYCERCLMRSRVADRAKAGCKPWCGGRGRPPTGAGYISAAELRTRYYAALEAAGIPRYRDVETLRAWQAAKGGSTP
jgi:hypothetical protein